MMNKRQLVEKINQLKKELLIYEEILNTPPDGFGRPRGTTYTQEQLAFLKANASLKDSEIITNYNNKFGTNIQKTSRQLYNLMQREGLGR